MRIAPVHRDRGLCFFTALDDKNRDPDRGSRFFVMEDTAEIGGILCRCFPRVRIVVYCPQTPYRRLLSIVHAEKFQ
jgi:hypothetical protein